MYTLLSIFTVIALVVTTFVLAEKYREEFGRNFIFNHCAWVILTGIIIAFFSYYSASGYVPDEQSTELLLAISTLGMLHGDVLPGEVSLDRYSGFFVFGLICIFCAWYINIKKSTFGWGMAQNVLQTIIVAALSVILAAIALLVASMKSRNKE